MPLSLSCASSRSLRRLVLSQTSRTAPSVAVPAAAPAQTSTLVDVCSRHYASSVAPVPLGALRLPDDYIPPTKPPAARRPELRKSQLLRTYTALLRSTPIILFFQHNNLTAVEWAAVRRELRNSLAEVPVPAGSVDISNAIEFQVLRTRIFDEAFKVTEFFDGEAAAQKSNAYTHDLSKTAYETIKAADLHDPRSTYAQMSPLLTGPLAAVLFPVVSPTHLAAALKILAPSPPAFPPPTRRKNPGYYDLTAQSALQKLMLVGGRIEGKAFDIEGVKWVGGIEGGLDGLRGQLVAMLQSAGLGLTTALEGHAKSLWVALEGRRTQLEEDQSGEKQEEPAK